MKKNKQSFDEVEATLNLDFDKYQEAEAIFSIVFRNLILTNWNQLVPEAQFQMTIEVINLLKSDLIAFNKKVKLGERWLEIETKIASTPKENIDMIRFLLNGLETQELESA